MTHIATASVEQGAIQAVSYALQLVVAGTFLLAAFQKLKDPRAFAQTVATYELLPRRLASPFAWIVIGSELGVAVALLTGKMVGVAIALGCLLAAAFGAATAINLRRGRDIDCGCFGATDEKISKRSLGRIALLGAALAALALALASERAVAVTPLPLGDGVAFSYTLEVMGIVAGLVIAATWALELPTRSRLVRTAVSHSRTSTDQKPPTLEGA